MTKLKKELPAYYPLTLELSQKLREANLTAGEWRFWAYMTEQEYCDNPNKLITPADIMRECKLAKSTYHQAKLKFQKLGLLEFHKSRTLLITLL